MFGVTRQATFHRRPDRAAQPGWLSRFAGARLGGRGYAGRPSSTLPSCSGAGSLAGPPAWREALRGDRRRGAKARRAAGRLVANVVAEPTMPGADTVDPSQGVCRQRYVLGPIAVSLLPAKSDCGICGQAVHGAYCRNEKIHSA